MCGGGGKTPEVPAAPVQSPPPTIQPTNVNPIATEGQRAQRASMMRKGVLSTIKTSPAGIVGTGADLTQQEGKKTLGG